MFDAVLPNKFSSSLKTNLSLQEYQANERFVLDKRPVMTRFKVASLRFGNGNGDLSGLSQMMWHQTF